MFAVYERDGWAQTDAFAAYGVCNLPLTPGFHDVEAHCWRCVGQGKVWYEWAVTAPVVGPVHNVNGRSYWVGL